MTGNDTIWAELPKLDSIPQLKLPQVDKTNINDINIYFYEDKSINVASVRVFFYNGVRSEHKIGIGELTLDMMLKETQNYTPEELFRLTDSIATEIDCQISHDFMTLTTTLLSQHVSKGLDIINEIMYSPKFSFEEFDKSYQSSKSDIEMIYSNPGTVANIVSNRIIFEGSRYEYGTNAYHKDLDTFTIDDCEIFYKDVFSKSKFDIIIVGNFDKEEIFNLIQEKFTQFYTEDNIQEKRELIKNTQIAIVDFPLNKQTNLRLFKNSIDIKHDDYLALSLANIAFGGYFLSRLNENLREDKGLTYGISSGITKNAVSSLQYIAASLSSANTRLAYDEIINEMELYSNESVSEEEFNRTRNYALGMGMRMYETSLSLIFSITNCLISDLPLNHDEIKFHKIGSTIQIQDIFNAQNKYFKSDNHLLVLVGDGKELASQFSGLPFNHYDKYGNLIESTQ